MSEEFTLSNDPPRPRPTQCPSNSKCRQQVLFAGLDCLPGQRDLFPTDGPANPAPEDPAGRDQIEPDAAGKPGT